MYFLPLNSSSLKTIAVIGDVGNLTPIINGEGSGGVIAPYIITPLQVHEFSMKMNCLREFNYELVQMFKLFTLQHILLIKQVGIFM